MNPKEHDKKRLPRAVELEKRNYIGFARQPVVDKSKTFASSDTPRSTYYLTRRPWFDA